MKFTKLFGIAKKHKIAVGIDEIPTERRYKGRNGISSLQRIYYYYTHTHTKRTLIRRPKSNNDVSIEWNVYRVLQRIQRVPLRHDIFEELRIIFYFLDGALFDHAERMSV